MTKVAINAEVVNGQCCVPICDSIAVSFLLCLGVHSLFSYLFNVLFFTFNAMAKEGLTSMNANSKDTLQYKRHTLRQMADKWQCNREIQSNMQPLSDTRRRVVISSKLTYSGDQERAHLFGHISPANLQQHFNETLVCCFKCKSLSPLIENILILLLLIGGVMCICMHSLPNGVQPFASQVTTEQSLTGEPQCMIP